MESQTLTSIGLILDFVGAVVLLVYSAKTTGAITNADQDYLASPWWPRVGWLLIAGGFLLQLLGNVL